MGPAGRFLDPLPVQALEPGIGVGLQDADERLQVCPGTLALAIRGVPEQHGGRIGAGCRTVIAYIGPQSPLLGRASART
jgi:hypothetical protein